MATTIQCPNCQKTLRLPDDADGKRVRCPACAKILVAPSSTGESNSSAPRVTEPQMSPFAPSATEPSMRAFASAPKTSPISVPVKKPNERDPLLKRPAPRDLSDSSVVGSAPMKDPWYLKTSEGQTFGPIDKSELDNWVADGRVTAKCQVLHEGEPEWQWADDVFAVLADGATEGQTKECAYCSEPIAVAAVKCKHCGSMLIPTAAPVEATLVPPQSTGSFNSAPAHSYQVPPPPVGGITTPLLISAISNILVGLFWMATCYGIIIAVPMLCLSIFEFMLHSEAQRLPPTRLASRAQGIAIFEIIVGLFNWVSLICGILVLVGAMSVEKTARLRR